LADSSMIVRASVIASLRCSRASLRRRIICARGGASPPRQRHREASQTRSSHAGQPCWGGSSETSGSKRLKKISALQTCADECHPAIRVCTLI
jgi:hypothetical protein